VADSAGLSRGAAMDDADVLTCLPICTPLRIPPISLLYALFITEGGAEAVAQCAVVAAAWRHRDSGERSARRETVAAAGTSRQLKPPLRLGGVGYIALCLKA